MTVARYAARTAAFAVTYLLAFWAGAFLFLSPLPVAALWMLVQGRWGLRRFDVITLVTATTVAGILGGTHLLSSLGLAAMVTLPALMFAVLVDRWAPGWWQGHGDRFRSPQSRLVRIAGAAALSVAAYLVLQAVLMPGISAFAVIFTLVRDVAAILLLTLAGRVLARKLSAAPATVAPLVRAGDRSHR
ncbi:hypothetical protein [Actinoplanes sp. L3-i22]|uniref:hypothetical protein n=1 Tax=Actinoplanes sp. L3-i22 TaxID=2836373 RepID=UPI001C758FFE|nr:hypothetical protein [Actinoplanes sp. L3-i22]BCY07527.1 hypothetical protein L3i22_026150 [Actinoplanes sp. L3-i22]